MKHLAILGATGAVGRELRSLIEERNLAVSRLTLLASASSSGSVVTVNGEKIIIKQPSANAFEGVDYAIFTAGSPRSIEFAPLAVEAGAVVIDNSSAFRLTDGVPLVIPEINPDDAQSHSGIIANPNCSTIIMNVALWPLHQACPIKRIVVSTYQAASGAGTAAMEELRTQSAAVLDHKPVTLKEFPHQIAFNLFSHDSPVGPDGYNDEERKMIDETRKIFRDPALAISATCVRVPVFRAHSETVNLTFTRPITPGEVREILLASPGLRIVDDPAHNLFPMPSEAAGRDEVLVGRIRQDAGQANGQGIELLICGDQLRKGAALNAIQILELLL